MLTTKRVVVALLVFATLGMCASLVVRIRKVRAARIAASVEHAPRAPWARLQVAETVYDGKLGVGWQDSGWGPHDLPNAGGPAKIGFAGFGGLILRHDLLRSSFGALSFRYRAPAGWPNFLQVELKSSRSADATLARVEVDESQLAEQPDGWREVRVDFADLNPSGAAFDRIVLSARSSVSADWVLIDKIVFTKPGAGAVPVAAPRREAALRVLCNGPSHPINPMIYGSAGGAWESGQSAQRLGGNPVTRLNWDVLAWNSANDWFFENARSYDPNALIDEAAGHGAPTVVTLPMIGWVAKDTTSVGFPASKFEKQRKYDPNRPQVGDGYRPDGKPIPPGPPSETSVEAPPALIGKWVRALRERDLGRTKRGIKTYILDNEPSLWDTTHRDVHAESLGYDELLDRTLRYATEIRKADPDATIAGPAEWGWLGYFYSAKDREAGKFVRPDRRRHGDVPLIPWYLQKIAEHEKRSNVRLLDILDVHFYPAADRVFGGSARVDPAGRALRLRSTRALWDPSYRDESWIEEPIRLIPRMKEWVAENHPGLAISLGEWSFGADKDISGALATAEVLGRFGQQALDSAFYWDGPKADTAAFWAFRAFRNFDGQGGRFLDESLDARGAEMVSLFASGDASKGHVVAVLINRHPEFEIIARVKLDSCRLPKAYRVFGYREGSTSLLLETPEALENDTLRVILPPYSIKVLDVTLAEPG